jgi:hypothetical protein
MTRKDSEKETDRPHYYSQFWLDVAAGRTAIRVAKGEDETDLVEDETEMSQPELEPTPLRRAGRNHAASANDSYKLTRSQTVIEPEEFEESEENEFEFADNVVDLELPDNVLNETEEEMIIPEADIMLDEDELEEEEDELFFDDELDNEDEDEEGWASRGRKKPKPGRQVKTPKLTKKPKREPRRGF